jgi:plasmid stabilization system protein ParE
MVIRWLPFANRELKKLYRLYAQKSVMTAQKIVAEITSGVNLLASSPYYGHVEPTLDLYAQSYRAIVVMNLFKVIHFVDENAGEVVIVDIWDCRQDPIYLQNKVKTIGDSSLN